MGAILVVPIVVIVMLVAVWLFWAARQTRQGHLAEQTLPDDPYSRRDEELHRLTEQHAAEEPDPASLPPHRRP